MGAEISGAALNAGSSILSTGLSGIFGRNQQKRQHQYDLELTQLNQEYGREMLKRQQDWQLQMWQAENEYNTASNQRKRLEEAGLNPYLMLDGGNAGTASSVTSPSSSPGNGSNTVSPFTVDTSGIKAAGNAFADYVNYANDYKSEQSRIKAATDSEQANAATAKAEASVAQAKAVETLEGIKLDNNNKDISNQITTLQRDLLQDTYDAQVNEAKTRADNARQELQGKILQNLLTSKTINTYDENFNRQMAFLSAQTLTQLAVKNLTEKQAITEIQNAWKTHCEAYGVHFNNQIVAKTAQAMIDKAYYEAEAIRTNLGPDNIFKVGYGAVQDFYQGIRDTKNALGNTYDKAVELGKKYGPIAPPVIYGFGNYIRKRYFKPRWR